MRPLADGGCVIVLDAAMVSEGLAFSLLLKEGGGLYRAPAGEPLIGWGGVATLPRLLLPGVPLTLIIPPRPLRKLL
jgi:hypothetical protein